MKILAIYDNGGKTLDRYTVVTDWKDGKYLMMLGMSEGGVGFSQWGSGQYNDKGQPNKHLGKRVPFETLSAATQEHIAQRVFAGEE